MKRILNSPDDIVAGMMSGLYAAHKDKLIYVPEQNIIARRDPCKSKVAVISGAGSGHEPDQAFFVGKGMLDAAAAGLIFSAPNAVSIYEAAKLVAGEKGVLFLYKNYTGDRIQFGMAAEMLEMDGIKSAAVIANDDVAVKDSTFTAGRRGVAGSILNYKITCAKAEKGASLEECVEIAERVNANVRSMGVALTSCTLPAKGTPNFELGPDEIEIGVGIHGEPGRQRAKQLRADEIIPLLTKSCVDDLPFRAGDEVAVMVNGFGGTPYMELYVAYNEVAKVLEASGIKTFRTYVGEYCTSLDMAGCSISLLKLDDEMKSLLDYPIDIPARYF